METVEGYVRSLTDGEFIAEKARQADSLYIHTASRLFDILLRSATSDFNLPITQLIVIPDGTLSNLNFSTVLTERPEQVDFRYNELRYLLRDFSVSYAFSSTLNFRETPSSSGLNFAGFAPSYEQVDYADIDSSNHPLAYQLVRDGRLPLPGAIAEVSEISEFLNGTSWINEEASESNFKSRSGNYRILHLAMHSLLNSDEPEYSELLFNNENDTLKRWLSYHR